MAAPHGSARSLTVFAWLWAAATLFHLASYRLADDSAADLALAAAAVLTLLRPGSSARFLALLATQLVELWIALPNVANHWLFTGIASLTLLLAAAQQAVARRTPRIDRGALWAAAAPVVRLELVLLYLLAFFHKLNRDYVDLDASCASYFLAALESRFPWLPDGPALRAGFVLGSLAVELAVPVLLLSRSRRELGILVGALFHVLLPLSPFPPQGVYNFSAMLFASYFAFAPASRVERLEALRPIVWLREQALRPGLGGAAWLGALCGALLVLAPAALWLAYAIALLLLFLASRPASGERPEPVRPVVALGSGSLWLGPALVLVTGLSPYLGLKTETSFAMFSNLRTEGGASNHWLVRKPLDLFGLQGDLVRVVASRDRVLASYAETGQLLTWLEFRDYLQSRKSVEVTYVRGREPARTIERLGDDPRLREPVPYLVRKLVRFRPVRLTSPVECVH